VRVSVLDPHVDDLDDLGVGQVDQRANLQLESHQQGVPDRVRALGRGALDDDLRLEMAIEGEEDLPHAPDAETPQDLVSAAGDLPTDPVVHLDHGVRLHHHGAVVNNG